MLSEMTLRLKGSTPILFHNGQLADPMSPHTKALKALSGLRKKTDETHLKMQEAEWRGGLYVNDKGAPCIPADMILAAIIGGAKSQKSGKQAKSGVFMPVDSFPLLYTGPKDVDGLWKSGKFLDVRGVRVNNSRVMRSRPIFRDWAVEITVMHNTDVVQADNLREWIVTAGLLIGIGDYRPQFGQFVVQ